MDLKAIIGRFIGESRSGVEYSTLSLGSRTVHYPNFNLEDYERYYLLDPVVFSAINSLADLVVGSGFYTEAEDERAKQIVDEFCEKVNMDEKLRDVARYVLLYGDAFMEKIFEGNRLVDVKVWSPKGWRILLDKKRNVIGYERITNAGVQRFSPEEVVHFRFVRVGDNEFGVSLIQPALDYLRAKHRIARLLPKVFMNYASPAIVYKFESESEAKRFTEFLRERRRVIEEEEEDLTKLFNEIVAFGRQLEVEPLRVDFRAQLIEYVRWLDENFNEGFRAPLMRYLYNATEASARVIYDAIRQTPIEALQRHIKRKVEGEIFKPLVDQEGIEEVPRLNWGVPKTVVDDLTLEDIVQIWDREPEYAKRLMVKKGFPPFDEEDKGVKEVDVETDPNVLAGRLLNKLDPLLNEAGRKAQYLPDRYEELIVAERGEGRRLIEEYVFLAWLAGRYRATRALGSVSFNLTGKEMKVIEAERRAWGKEWGALLEDYTQTIVRMERPSFIKAKRGFRERVNNLASDAVFRPFNMAKVHVWRSTGRCLRVQFVAPEPELTHPKCGAFHGKVFDICKDEVPVPPLHPGCRSTLILLTG